MYKKLIFFNHFGAGDVYESREFVKAWMALLPDCEYYYAHGKNPKILRDIVNLKFTDVTPMMDSMRDAVEVDGVLYVNTWIGRDGSYVLPGIGCTPEMLLKMYNDILRRLKLGRLPGNPIDYIPKIDYSHYFPEISRINDFMLNQTSEMIFVDNGLCQSNQAYNFDFNSVILRLSGQYPDKLFITTHKVPGSFSNIVCTSEIIKSEIGFDLNEVAYLSHFCSTLIGRNSGPHVYTQNYANCMDEKKKLVSFTYNVEGSSFVVNTPVKIRKYWSPYETDEDIFKRIKEILDE